MMYNIEDPIYFWSRKGWETDILFVRYRHRWMLTVDMLKQIPDLLECIAVGGIEFFLRQFSVVRLIIFFCLKYNIWTDLVRIEALHCMMSYHFFHHINLSIWIVLFEPKIFRKQFIYLERVNVCVHTILPRSHSWSYLIL